MFVKPNPHELAQACERILGKAKVYSGMICSKCFDVNLMAGDDSYVQCARCGHHGWRDGDEF